MTDPLIHLLNSSDTPESAAIAVAAYRDPLRVLINRSDSPESAADALKEYTDDPHRR